MASSIEWMWRGGEQLRGLVHTVSHAAGREKARRGHGGNGEQRGEEKRKTSVTVARFSPFEKMFKLLSNTHGNLKLPT
jgi:hypothetical protein